MFFQREKCKKPRGKIKDFASRRNIERKTNTSYNITFVRKSVFGSRRKYAVGLSYWSIIFFFITIILFVFIYFFFRARFGFNGVRWRWRTKRRQNLKKYVFIESQWTKKKKTTKQLSDPLKIKWPWPQNSFH